MNVNNVLTKDYENETLGKRGKNKAKTNPIQTQFKANTNPIQSQYKPNTKPIQTQTNPISKKAKMNVTSVLTRNYEQRTMNNEL